MSAKGQLQNVNFPQAVRLKAEGFDWETVTHYGADGEFYDYPEDGSANWSESDILVSAPTVALATSPLQSHCKSL